MNVEKRTDRIVAKPDVDGADAAMERYSNGDNAAFAEFTTRLRRAFLASCAKPREMTAMRRT